MDRRPFTRWLKPIRSRITRRNAVIALGVAVLGGAAWAVASRHEGPEDWAASLAAPGERLTTVCFTGDGRRIVAGCASGNLVVWELPAGAPQTLPRQSEKPILALAVLGGTALGGGDDAALHSWPLDAMPGTPEARTGFSAPIACLAVSGDGSRLAVGLSDGTLLVLGGETPAIHAGAHPGGVRAVAISPDGRLLVTGGADGRIAWRNPQAAGEPLAVSSMSTEIGALAFSPDGAELVAGDWNGQLLWLDAKTRTPLAERAQPDAVSGVAVVGSATITAAWDGRVRFWSRGARDPMAERRSRRPVSGLAVNPEGTLAATVSGDARVLLWQSPIPP